MSVRSLTRSGITALTTVATAGLLVAGGTSLATADPPALDTETCSTTLARVTIWPGSTSDGVRLVSDAYDSYLSRQDVCHDAH